MAAPTDRLHYLQFQLKRIECEIAEAIAEYNLCLTIWAETGHRVQTDRKPSHKTRREWMRWSQEQLTGMRATRLMLKAKILEEERGSTDYVIEGGELDNLFAVEENVDETSEKKENVVEAIEEIVNVEAVNAVIDNAIVGVQKPKFKQPPPAPRYTPVIECFVCNFEPGYDGHLLTDCFYAMVTMPPAKLANFLKFQARCFRCFQKAGFGENQHNSMTCKHPRWCDKHVYGTRGHHAVLCGAGPILKTQQNNNM